MFNNVSTKPTVSTGCKIDVLPRNGSISKTFFSIPMPLSVGYTVKNDDHVEYQCEDGYKLQGNATRECIDSKWTAEAPTCEPKGVYLVSHELILN